MRVRLQIASSLLIIGTTFCFSNCGLSGATRDRLLKTIPISGSSDLAALSPDGETLATVDRTDLSSGKYAIRIIQISDGRIKYSTDKYPIYGLAFSLEGSILAATCSDGVRLFRTVDGQLLRTLAGNQLFAAAFSPNGEVLASGGAEGEVEIRRVSDGSLLHKYSVGKWITSLAFSPNGEVLAAGTSANIGFVLRSDASTEDNPIILWRVTENLALATLTGHKYGVLSLAFSDDGTILASGGSDGFVKLWRVLEKSLIKSHKIVTESGVAEKPEATINHLSFGPDSKSLAVAYDKEILLLHPDDLTTSLTLKGHTGAVLHLHFNRDGTLASFGQDKTIRLWRLG